MELPDLRNENVFDKLPWSELEDAHQLERVSGGATVWDVMGEPPAHVYLARGGATFAGDRQVSQPRDSEYYVVDGDLSIEGTLALFAMDHTSAVVVTGDLHATCVVVSWDMRLYVVGKAQIDGPLVVNTSDAGLVLLKDCEARAIFSLGRRALRLDQGQEIRHDLRLADWPDYSEVFQAHEVGV